MAGLKPRGRKPAATPSPAEPAAVVAPVGAPLAAIDPAIEAAADRAAAERVADPAAAQPLPPIAAEPGVVPLAIGDASLPTTVLPEPALVPPEGVVPPVVTASPPLAGEPSAIDVMKAATAAVAGPATDPATGLAPALAAAGQPVLTIQPGPLGAAAVAAEAAGSPLPIDPDDADGVVTVLEVTGPVAGRWRGGLAFGPEPRRFLPSQLTEAQLDRIQADPQLSWRLRNIDALDAAKLAD